MRINKPVYIETICKADQICDLAEEWNKVLKNCSHKSFFLSLEYIKLWYQCFATIDQVRILRFYDDDQTIGFLPLVIYKKKGIRVLESLNNDHCVHSGPLIYNGQEDIFEVAVLDGLSRLSKEWDVLKYSYAYSFIPFTCIFSEKILTNHKIKWNRNFQPSYTVKLDKTFDEYFRKDLSQNTRKNFSRYRNRIRKAGNWEILHYQGKNAVGKWPEFQKIEDSGWKGKKGTSIKKLSGNYRTYYEKLVQMLADKNVLHIYFVAVNSQLIAGVFGYEEEETFHWFKTGYDESYKEFSPSNILILYIIRDLTENKPKIKYFHMFPSDNNYKHKYANCSTFCIDTILYSPCIKGNAVYRIGRITKEMKKSRGIKKLVNMYKKFVQ